MLETLHFAFYIKPYLPPQSSLWLQHWEATLKATVVPSQFKSPLTCTYIKPQVHVLIQATELPVEEANEAL